MSCDGNSTQNLSRLSIRVELCMSLKLFSIVLVIMMLMVKRSCYGRCYVKNVYYNALSLKFKPWPNESQEDAS